MRAAASRWWTSAAVTASRHGRGQAEVVRTRCRLCLPAFFSPFRRDAGRGMFPAVRTGSESTIAAVGSGARTSVSATWSRGRTFCNR